MLQFPNQQEDVFNPHAQLDHPSLQTTNQISEDTFTG